MLIALVGVAVPVRAADGLPGGEGASPVRLGCFYFPGWFSADRWVPIQEHGRPTPLLGAYRDSSPEVHDWQIRWATQHGISFWVFDWYYRHQTGEVSRHNAALEEGFLRASLRERMEFAVMWCNEEREPPSYTEEEMLRLARTLDERYLRRGNYLRVAKGGRCFVVVSRPQRVIERFGVEGTRAVLKKMSDAVATHGGLYFVANCDPQHDDLQRLRGAGFAACTLYCYSGHGLPGGAREGPYDSLIPAAESMWRRVSESGAVKAIPTISPRWDSRPWYGDKGLVRTGYTPEKLERLCRAIRPFIDPELRMALVGTWNEFGEGTHIEPTREEGFGSLDAIQRALFPERSGHRHQVPGPAEPARLTYAEVPSFMEREIERQGENRAINPGMERDWGWVYYDQGPAAYDTKEKHSGKRSLIIPKAEGGAKSQVLAPGVPWKGRWSNLIPVERGRRYRVGAWVRGAARIQCALFDADGNWLKRYAPIVEGGKPGAWRRVEGELRLTDPEVAFVNLEFVPLGDVAHVDDVEMLVDTSDAPVAK